MADITEDDVTTALGAVIDPSQGKSVVELGMVGPIHIKQSNISFALEVPAHRGPAMEPVRKAAETAVRAIPGVTSATVVVTAHSGPAATSASAGGGDDRRRGCRARPRDQGPAVCRRCLGQGRCRQIDDGREHRHRPAARGAARRTA